MRDLGRRGRAGNRQPVAARHQRDAELALDPVEMLVALAVKQRQQQIVVEFELAAPGPAASATMVRRQRALIAPPRHAAAMIPARLLGSAPRDQHRHDLADPLRRGVGMDALQIGAAADELAVMPARLFEQHRQDAADAGVVERALLLAAAAPATRRAARP